MGAILIIGTEQFSNFESPCHPDTYLQVSAQSDLLYWKGCGLKNFKMAAILGIRRIILAILNFHNTPMPPIKFKLTQTYHSGADVI